MNIRWLNHHKYSTDNDIVIVKTIPAIDHPTEPTGKQLIVIVAGFGTHITFKPVDVEKRKDRTFDKMAAAARKHTYYESKMKLAGKEFEFYQSIYVELTKKDEQGEHKT